VAGHNIEQSVTYRLCIKCRTLFGCVTKGGRKYLCMNCKDPCDHRFADEYITEFEILDEKVEERTGGVCSGCRNNWQRSKCGTTN